MITEYSIISATSLPELAQKVNRFIVDFQAEPLGGPVSERRLPTWEGLAPTAPGNHDYHQAMIRRQPDGE